MWMQNLGHTGGLRWKSSHQLEPQGEASEHRVVGQGVDFGVPRWRSKLPAGSGGPGRAGAWLKLGSLKRRPTCFPAAPTTGWGAVGKASGWKKQDPGHSPSVFTFFVLSRWIFSVI